MYNLPHHKEQNQEEIIQFMKDHSFIFLTGSDVADKPVATQVPVFIDEKGGRYFLTGHIRRLNKIIMFSPYLQGRIPMSVLPGTQSRWEVPGTI